MKIAARDVSSLIKAPPAAYQHFLLHGSDTGLMTERMRSIALNFCDNLDDPFSVERLDSTQIKEDPALLADAVSSLSFTGEARLVLVSGKGAELLKAVKSVLEIDNAQGRMVITAYDVNSRHALVKLADSARNFASIACYPDEMRDLRTLATDIFAKDNIQCSPEAMAVMMDRLGGDRAASRSELEKLVLLAGPGGTLSEGQVNNALGDSSGSVTDGVLQAVFSGQIQAFEQAMRRVRQENIASIALQRSALSMMKAIFLIRLTMDQGQSLEQSMGQLRPPPHFKTKPLITKWATGFKTPAIRQQLDRLIDLELQLKSSSSASDYALLGQVFLGIALRAKQLFKR